MKIHLVDRNGRLTLADRDLAERRLLFALARFDPKIVRVTCTMEEFDGTREEVGIACRIAVLLRGTNDVVIHEQAANLEGCVSRAAERAGRAVARSIDRACFTARTGVGSFWSRI